MARKSWLPLAVGGGFYDLVEEAAPKLTRGEFGLVLKKSLQQAGLSGVLSRELIDLLHQKAYHFLKQIEALEKMRQIVSSPDWNSRKALLRRVPKDVNLLRERLGKRAKQGQSLTNALLDSIIGQLRVFQSFLTAEFQLTSRLIRNDERLVSTSLKPELESQLMLELDDFLARRMPGCQVQRRRLIIAGCAIAARLVPATDRLESLPQRINMRIHRAKIAARRDSSSWKDKE